MNSKILTTGNIITDGLVIIRVGASPLYLIGLAKPLLYAKVTVIGAGGAGDGVKYFDPDITDGGNFGPDIGNIDNSCRGGGGAGACVIGYYDEIDPYKAYFSIGVGGNYPGKAGQESWFSDYGDNFIKAGGGSSGSSYLGGEGGIPTSYSSNTLLFRGNNGLSAFNSNNFTSYSGSGGSSFLGTGGRSISTDQTLRTEMLNGTTNTGAGGAGGNQNERTNGIGADGIIIIEYKKNGSKD